jgi:hypothetical protein
MAGSEELIGHFRANCRHRGPRRRPGQSSRRARTPDLRFDAGSSPPKPTGARLTCGKNICSKATVVFSQSLQNSGGTTWIVTYAPQSRIELRAVSLDNGDRLYGFRHDLIFGDVSPATRAPAAAPPQVTNIQITGAGTDEAALRSRLTFHAGDRFSFFNWQDDRDRLEQFPSNAITPRPASRPTASPGRRK